MPFSLPASFNPGDSYTNTHANNVAAAINAIVNNLATAYVATNESTASTTYTDLTTTTDQVTVTIGQSGTAIVVLTCYYYNSGTAYTYVSFAVSGANTQAAADSFAIAQGGAGAAIGNSGLFVLTGLAPGATTFKMKYKATAGTGIYQTRRIAVIPFP